ncbi:helix-turn-helix domain-containing protein [Proteiniborus sp. MB09-C3]|uniref:helix-turn-helix domain-containing protein n=1 Tax=Proteiniborus sp. MB09-C3 TaxID=3050072 RepID=UPI0025538D2F|nr:helix-turn-helix domain-containing protein [Proteiniborus sp. MB09-C3]WIV13374.1 helix-turn-helix domain-containing protein [Proteiniborus sp. MB09-C3]
MRNEHLIEKIMLAKKDIANAIFFIDRYKPLIIKYSTINGIFYEDLYSDLLEITLIAIKKFKYLDIV